MAFPVLGAIGLGLQAAGIGASIWGQNKYQSDQMRMMDRMNKYNSPASQMKRFEEAGLNPHLVYGQGSPGNQSSPVQTGDYRHIGNQIAQMSQTLPLINQTRLVDSQVDAKNAETLRTGAMTAIAKIQARLLERNPLLNDVGFKATIDGLKATAESKVMANKVQRLETDYLTGKDLSSAPGAIKVQQILTQLVQRTRLNELELSSRESDLAIKAQVLKSKEFQNQILEVQKKFLVDGDITPQHIVQFIQLLLMKML